MTNKLKQHFPMLRTRNELLTAIYERSSLKNQFNRWTTKQQEEFLSFCTGARGVKMLYPELFMMIHLTTAKAA